MLRRARSILGSEAEAQEVLHDVFTSLLQKPDQFAGHSSPMTFLYRMTTNAALGRLRSVRNRTRLLARHHAEERPLPHPGHENLIALREWLTTLSEPLAQVALYYHLDDMSQDEIAEVMGCSRQWVGKLLTRVKAVGSQRRVR